MVQKLHWRIITDRMWSPAAAEMYHAGPLHKASASEMARHNKARRAAKQIHDSLYPEDD